METRSTRRIRLTRHFRLIAGIASLAVLAYPSVQAAAQEQVPPAPAQTHSAPAQSQAAPAQEPSAPAPAGPPVFPKPDPANFTAASPSKEAVDAFLEQSWGYDENRVWQVEAIYKTSVEGISKVIVYVGDKTGKQKPSALQFLSFPTASTSSPATRFFPSASIPTRTTASGAAEQRADGPYQGSASKDLELVEFADFQCPHCKEAQANMEKLATDFPKARIVFQNYPLEKIHPEASAPPATASA